MPESGKPLEITGVILTKDNLHNGEHIDIDGIDFSKMKEYQIHHSFDSRAPMGVAGILKEGDEVKFRAMLDPSAFKTWAGAGEVVPGDIKTMYDNKQGEFGIGGKVIERVGDTITKFEPKDIGFYPTHKEKPEEINFGEEKPNVYEKAKAKLKEQDLSPLDRKMKEVGIECLHQLKDGDIVILKPTRDISPNKFKQVMETCNATKELFQIDIKFLVVPHDFELKILRPEG